MTQTTDRGCKAVKETWFGRFNTEIEIPEPPEGYEDWIVWDLSMPFPGHDVYAIGVGSAHKNTYKIKMNVDSTEDCFRHKSGLRKVIAYCVKRKPVVENITICGVKVYKTDMDSPTRFIFNNTEYHFKQGKGEYSISFDVVDGEVDCDSVTMKKLEHPSTRTVEWFGYVS